MPQQYNRTACDNYTYKFVFVFVVRSLDLYKAKSPLDIELVNG